MAHPLINISKKQAVYFAVFLVLYQFLTYIANDMIMPGMVSIIKTFHGHDSDIATSLTAYVLGGASLQILLGPLSDRFGRRPVMIFGAIIFTLFSLLIACSQSMSQFFIARYFQGMGLCFISVVGYATVQEIFEEMDAIRIIALLSNLASLAPLLGPLAGAVFITYFSWRGIFLLIGFFAVVALVGLWRYMPESIGVSRKNHPIIVSSPLSFATVLTNYLTLLKSLPFLLGSIALGLISVPIVAWIAISPVMLITSSDLTVYQYALWQLPIFGAGVLGNFALRKLSYRFSVDKLIIMGISLCALGLGFCYVFLLLINQSFINLIPGLLLYSFGASIVTAPLNRKILFFTPLSKGTASALMSMVSMCLQAVGIEIANVMYSTKINLNFGLFCASVGLVAFVLTLYCLTYIQRSLINLGIDLNYEASNNRSIN